MSLYHITDSLISRIKQFVVIEILFFFLLNDFFPINNNLKQRNERKMFKSRINIFPKLKNFDLE